jgi:hypothetical protein
MSTQKQIEANRRNALRSTGPRTEAGKARSSFNALTHGAYSKQLLTPDESDADLARLERMYVAHYRPPTELELEEVRQLASLAWRLGRYARMETEILTDHGYEREHDQGIDQFSYAGPGWGFTHDCSKAHAVQALAQVEERLSRRFAAIKKQLDERLAQRVKPDLSGGPWIAKAGGTSIN